MMGHRYRARIVSFLSATFPGPLLQKGPISTATVWSIFTILPFWPVTGLNQPKSTSSNIKLKGPRKKNTINISPLWRPDLALECANRIRANVPADSGLALAQFNAVDKELANVYSRRTAAGKDQYIIASDTIMRRFAKYHAHRRIVPDEWFPSNPPSTAVLALYAEMNIVGGPNLTLVKEFYRAPRFQGMDSRLFLHSAHGTHIMANRDVTLFRFKKVARGHNK